MNRKLIGCILFVLLSGFMANNHAGTIQSLVTALSAIFIQGTTSEKYTDKKEDIKTDMYITFGIKDAEKVTLALSDDNQVYFFGNNPDNKIISEAETHELITKFTDSLEKWKTSNTTKEASNSEKVKSDSEPEDDEKK